MITLSDITDYEDESDPEYPGGKAVDAPTDESFEGTPLVAAWMNDLGGFSQALLIRACGNLNGVSHVPDSAYHSDRLDALIGVIRDLISTDVNAGKIFSGLLALARGGTGVDNSAGGTGNTVFARPSGAAGAASFRALVAADIPAV